MEFQVMIWWLWAERGKASCGSTHPMGKPTGSVLQDILQVALWVQVCEPGQGVGMAGAGDTQQSPRPACSEIQGRPHFLSEFSMPDPVVWGDSDQLMQPWEAAPHRSALPKHLELPTVPAPPAAPCAWCEETPVWKCFLRAFSPLLKEQ